MRKFEDPMSTGGAPIFIDDLIWSNNDTIAVLEGIYKRAYEFATFGVVVSGCEVTSNGSNVDIAPGIVYIQGRFRTFDGAVNKPKTGSIVLGADAVENREFQDTNVNPIIRTAKAVHSSALSSNGQVIPVLRVPTNGHGGWTQFTSVGGSLQNAWGQNGTAPLEFKINSDATISWRGELLGGSITSDTVFAGTTGFADISPGSDGSGNDVNYVGTAAIPNTTTPLNLIMTSDKVGNYTTPANWGLDMKIVGANSIKPAICTINMTYSLLDTGNL